MSGKKGLFEAKKGQLVDWLKKLFNTRRKKIIGLMVLLSILGLASWRLLAGKKETPQLQTTLVERGIIISSVSASGQVLSVNIMSANTKASGIVKEVYVKDGQLVKKGDKILEIDFDLQGEQKYISAWSSYLSAKNSLESAKVSQYSLQSDLFQQWNTFKTLAENSTYTKSDGSPDLENRNLPAFRIAQNDWLAAEAKYKNQQATIAQSQAALNNTWLSYLLASPIITAPADGEVTSLMFAKGMSIGTLDTGSTTSNQKVATIKTEGRPIVSVNLSEIDVSRVQTDQKATITLDSIPDKTFTGVVVGVDRIGQTTSGVTQYPAIIQLDFSSPEILPNLTVTAQILIDRKDNVLLVPSGAIQEQGGQNYVTVLKNGQEQLVPVETGLASDTQTEIISGLNEGDLVVTGAAAPASQEGASPFGAGGFGGIMRIAH